MSHHTLAVFIRRQADHARKSLKVLNTKVKRTVLLEIFARAAIQQPWHAARKMEMPLGLTLPGLIERAARILAEEEWLSTATAEALKDYMLTQSPESKPTGSTLKRPGERGISTSSQPIINSMNDEAKKWKGENLAILGAEDSGKHEYLAHELLPGLMAGYAKDRRKRGTRLPRRDTLILLDVQGKIDFPCTPLNILKLNTHILDRAGQGPEAHRCAISNLLREGTERRLSRPVSFTEDRLLQQVTTCLLAEKSDVVSDALAFTAPTSGETSERASFRESLRLTLIAAREAGLFHPDGRDLAPGKINRIASPNAGMALAEFFHAIFEMRIDGLVEKISASTQNRNRPQINCVFGDFDANSAINLHSLQ
ncbi:MAG: hypothetical protein R3268_02340, partial [Acidiferrobacterales bacterium]|nr:hypothetical protein [Acidiferrobacterales bacterium]